VPKADRHHAKRRNKKSIETEKEKDPKIRISVTILIVLIDLISTAFLYSKVIKRRRIKKNINRKRIKVDQNREAERRKK
jgi:hypothetical protein